MNTVVWWLVGLAWEVLLTCGGPFNPNSNCTGEAGVLLLIHPFSFCFVEGTGWPVGFVSGDSVLCVFACHVAILTRSLAKSLELWR